MNTLRDCLLAAADAVEAAREELGTLDGFAGDGDHGTTMAIGARTVRQRLESTQVTGPELLDQAAAAMGSVGGAIGPIYATGLLRVAALDPAEPPGVRDLRLAAEVAETAVTRLGGAKPGDKSILDAIHAVVESLRRSETRNDDLQKALTSAANAARDGAASTAQMVAMVGRASRLGERSRGHADPGATSFAIALGAMVQAYLTPPTARTETT